MVAGVTNMASLTVNLPDRFLSVIAQQKQNVTREVRRYLAIGLYAEGKLSMGSAAALADMSYSDFLDLVGKLGLGPMYTEEHLEEDLKTLRELEEL
ncbi:MAG: UPF0175 family protein [Armatimonadetes bacterium]|nr:UPF0175 family protein [Armatimonadota bacterium]